MLRISLKLYYRLKAGASVKFCDLGDRFFYRILREQNVESNNLNSRDRSCNFKIERVPHRLIFPKRTLNTSCFMIIAHLKEKSIR